MTPISQHIIINPHPVSKSLASGLSSLKNSPIHKATVLKVSEDIYKSPLQAGDDIIYMAGRLKWIAGECILNLEMVIAKL